MTINVTSSEIQIKNSYGTVKFTSASKLIYQKYYQTGTISTDGTAIWVPFNALAGGDFLTLTIKINSADYTSEILAPLIGKDIPANGTLIIDFYGRNVNNQAAADSEILGVNIVNNFLIFKSTRFDNNGNITNGSRLLNLTYKARILSYL